MITQCCVCKKIKRESDARWTASKAELTGETVSHGYCPSCAEEVMRRFDTYYPPMESPRNEQRQGRSQ